MSSLFFGCYPIVFIDTGKMKVQGHCFLYQTYMAVKFEENVCFSKVNIVHFKSFFVHLFGFNEVKVNSLLTKENKVG